MELLTENNFIGSEQPKIPPRVYPAGRLDKDSEGLVLLTNDGGLTEKITHPKFEHKKVYQVWINKKLTHKNKEKLESGFQLKDRKKEQVQGIKVKNLKNDNKEQIVTVALKEGKYRQIRRMFNQLGYKIKKLKRIRISKLSLGLLPKGKWKLVEKSDIIS
jgi:pseudouridine synthase